MIGIKRIDHINMRVKNLAESVEFYRENFGFEMKEDESSAREPWVVIGLPGVAYLCMYEHPTKTKLDDGLMLMHFGFALENFDQALGTVGAQGLKVLFGGPVQWPSSRSIYIEDPNGYVIELAEKVGGGLN